MRTADFLRHGLCGPEVRVDILAAVALIITGIVMFLPWGPNSGDGLFSLQNEITVGAYAILLGVLILLTPEPAKPLALFMAFLLSGAYVQRILVLAWRPESLKPAVFPVTPEVVQPALLYLSFATAAIFAGIHIGAKWGSRGITGAHGPFHRFEQPNFFMKFLAFAAFLLAANMASTVIFQVGIVGLGVGTSSNIGWIFRALSPVWILPSVLLAVLIERRDRLSRMERTLAISFIGVFVVYTLLLSSRAALLTLLFALMIALTVCGQLRLSRRTIAAMVLVVLLSILVVIPATTALRLFWVEVYSLGAPSAVAAGNAVAYLGRGYADIGGVVAFSSKIGGLADVLFGAFAIGKDSLAPHIRLDHAFAQLLNGFLPGDPIPSGRSFSEVIPEVMRGRDLETGMFHREHPTLLVTSYVLFGPYLSIPLLALWGAIAAMLLRRPIDVVWKVAIVQYSVFLFFNQGTFTGAVHPVVDVVVVYGIFLLILGWMDGRLPPMPVTRIRGEGRAEGGTDLEQQASTTRAAVTSPPGVPQGERKSPTSSSAAVTDAGGSR